MGLSRVLALNIYLCVSDAIDGIEIQTTYPKALNPKLPRSGS